MRLQSTPTLETLRLLRRDEMPPLQEHGLVTLPRSVQGRRIIWIILLNSQPTMSFKPQALRPFSHADSDPAITRRVHPRDCTVHWMYR